MEGLPIKLKGNFITSTNTLDCVLSLKKMICEMNFVIWLIKFSLINLVFHSEGSEMQESFMIVCLIILIMGRLTLDRILWNHSRPSVPLSIYPSFCLSLNFVKIGSIIFSDIVRDDSWPWYLVTDKARFLKESFLTEFGLNWKKIGPKIRFFAIFANLIH